jgi:hypothetical protein
MPFNLWSRIISTKDGLFFRKLADPRAASEILRNSELSTDYRLRAATSATRPLLPITSVCTHG